MKFFKCNICGNIVEMVDDKNGKLSCCGKEMVELIPGSVDASMEKHVPVIEEKDGEVIIKVGEVPHPMLNEHYIEWIVVHTDQGFYRKHLKPGQEPMAKFALLNNEIVLSAYAFCNLHGLWKKILLSDKVNATK